MTGLPNLIINSYKSDGVGKETTLITGYREQPVPTSGLPAYWCGSAVRDLSRSHGSRPFQCSRIYQTSVRFHNCKALPLTFRSSCCSDAYPFWTASTNRHRQCRTCLRLLMRSSTPRELLGANDPDVQLLMTARTEVNRELARAKRSPPRFSRPVALICVNPPCQVHPQIAQIWRRRLPEDIS